MDKKGGGREYHNFHNKFVVSHSTEKLIGGTLLCFKKFLVSKTFMDKRGEGRGATIRNRKNIWHHRDSNPGPTVSEPCCPNPTVVIYFWIKRVGNFGLKKRKTTLLNNFSCILHMRRKITERVYTRSTVATIVYVKEVKKWLINRTYNSWFSPKSCLNGKVSIPGLTWHANHTMNHELPKNDQFTVMPLLYCSFLWQRMDHLESFYDILWFPYFSVNFFSTINFSFLLQMVSNNSKVWKASGTSNANARQQFSEFNFPRLC